MEQYIQKAKVLLEALPYIQTYENKIFVIKYGGNITHTQLDSIVRDIVLLKSVGIKVVVVHGAGPQISDEMKKQKLEPKFVRGLRVTDAATVKIVEKVFGEMSSEILSLIKKYGEKGKGVFGSEFDLIRVKQKDPELGFVGDIKKVNPQKIKKLLRYDYIPVISPVGIDSSGQVYNINADTAAAALAVALKAEKFTLLTNVEGIMKKGKVIPTLTAKQARAKIRSGVISGGMIPKAEACIYAVRRGGCKKAHLINGEREHTLLIEIFTNAGTGTEIVK